MEVPKEEVVDGKEESSSSSSSKKPTPNAPLPLHVLIETFAEQLKVVLDITNYLNELHKAVHFDYQIYKVSKKVFILYSKKY